MVALKKSHTKISPEVKTPKISLETQKKKQKKALSWLPYQASGVIGSELQLVGPVPAYCDCVKSINYLSVAARTIRGVKAGTIYLKIPWLVCFWLLFFFRGGGGGVFCCCELVGFFWVFLVKGGGGGGTC